MRHIYWKPDFFNIILGGFLTILVITSVGFGGHHLYRVINFLEETTVGVLAPYEDEDCWNQDLGNGMSIEHCDDVIRYPYMVKQYWSDTETFNTVVRTTYESTWKQIEKTHGWAE